MSSRGTLTSSSFALPTTGSQSSSCSDATPLPDHRRRSVASPGLAGITWSARCSWWTERQNRCERLCSALMVRQAPERLRDCCHSSTLVRHRGSSRSALSMRRGAVGSLRKTLPRGPTSARRGRSTGGGRHATSPGPENWHPRRTSNRGKRRRDRETSRAAPGGIASEDQPLLPNCCAISGAAPTPAPETGQAKGQQAQRRWRRYIELDNQVVAREPIRNEVPELVDASSRGVLAVDIELVRDERIEKQTGRLGEVRGQSGETADAFGDTVKIGIAGAEQVVHRVVAVVRESGRTAVGRVGAITDVLGEANSSAERIDGDVVGLDEPAAGRETGGRVDRILTGEDAHHRGLQIGQLDREYIA